MNGAAALPNGPGMNCRPVMVAVKANLVTPQCFDHVQPTVAFQCPGVIPGQVEVADQTLRSQKFRECFDVVVIFRHLCHFGRERENNMRTRSSLRDCLCGRLHLLIRSQKRGLDVVEHR
jgi:hypothetical protein